MDIDQCLARAKEAKLLTERELRVVCIKVKEILTEESNCEPVSTPVTVAGDIHGQFFDVLELFKKGGQMPNTRYIFIGDFVDRGAHSVETLTLLLLLKIKYPKDIFLLRGNHETRTITMSYGFYEEIQKKYGNANPWTYFVDVFDYLPLAAIVDSKVLCIHGGCSPEIQTLDQLRAIDRKSEPPNEGAFADILWSDPNDSNEGWVVNNRGAGWLYGSRVVREFNQLNDLTLIARAHQLVNEGYKFSFEPAKSLVTVWSAPNYTYTCGNLASLMTLKEDLNPNFIVFSQSPHSKNVTDMKFFMPYFL